MLLLLSAPISAAPLSDAQRDSERLRRTVTLMDKAMFDAFNDCNMAEFAQYYDEEVEFYHDQAGLSVSRDTLVEDIRKNICGKQRRERTGQPFEILPLADFGALQMGEHLFCHPRSGECHERARFIHVWRHHQGTWRVTRVVSYDHRPLQPRDPMSSVATARKQLVDEKMPEWLESHGVPSAGVALIMNGELAWSDVYGEQSQGTPATGDTLYNVASLTKPIAAEVILRLAAAGKFSLDESVADSWVDPDLSADPRHRALTPRLCLQHRTGLPNWRWGGDNKLRFHDSPDERFGYSGEGYDYAARFAQSRLGESFIELANRHVFEPIGMRDTSFVRRPWFAGRVAVPMGPAGSFGEPHVFDTWSAADNLYATISDYALFVVSVMKAEGLTPEIASARFHPDRVEPNMGCADDGDRTTCPQTAGVGLGWMVFDYGKESVVMHTGRDWGENAIAFFVPERNFGVVVLTNGAKGMSVIREVAAVLYDDPRFAHFVASMAE